MITKTDGKLKKMFKKYTVRYLTIYFRWRKWNPEKIHMFFKYHQEQVSKRSVSVIIPNYNYAEFLEERILSILNQSIKPSQIIFMDDCSTDNSVLVAKKLLENSTIPYEIIEQDTNIGCFGQWVEGISRATGDLIWIAEADDKCEINFLETLVPAFSDSKVTLAYSQSIIIDGKGKISKWQYASYTKDINKKKWKENFIRLGIDEISDSLAIKNTIPNASAVVMKRSALAGIERKLKNFSSAGDWFTYIYLLKRGKIFFSAKPLNYHRRHERSIIHKTMRDLTLFLEIIKIKNYLLQEFHIPINSIEKMIEYLNIEFNHGIVLEEDDEKRRTLKKKIQSEYDDFVALAKNKINEAAQIKNILFVIISFTTGGGEIFPIRLANHFAKTHNVFIYVLRPESSEPFIEKIVSDKVRILTGLPLKKIDKLVPDLNFYIKNYKIDVVNSHYRDADILAYLALRDFPEVKWTISCHGAYDVLCDGNERDILVEQYGGQMFERANSITYAADKNRGIFVTYPLKNLNKLRKISNGYENPNAAAKKRSDLGIPEEAFVFGQVSRAIPEKGWEQTIRAFCSLDSRIRAKCHLVLLAVGPYMEKLKSCYESEKNIHFITEISEPQEWLGWVQTFNVGLLPTYYKAESFPTVIVEYISCNKPVIATDVAEIPQMLHYKNKDAGILISCDPFEGVKWEDLKTAMEKIYLEKILYDEYRENCIVVFEQFSMELCVEKYFDAYMYDGEV